MEKTYYQAPTAAVLGDVELGDGVSVWFSSVVRGDESRIKIGNQTNIQENCTVHVEEGHPVLVGGAGDGRTQHDSARVYHWG